jgi:hypothetical protein
MVMVSSGPGLRPTGPLALSRAPGPNHYRRHHHPHHQWPAAPKWGSLITDKLQSPSLASGRGPLPLHNPLPRPFSSQKTNQLPALKTARHIGTWWGAVSSCGYWNSVFFVDGGEIVSPCAQRWIANQRGMAPFGPKIWRLKLILKSTHFEVSQNLRLVSDRFLNVQYLE